MAEGEGEGLQAELEAARQEASERAAERDAALGAAGEATSAYLAAVQAANPDVPASLITGSTVAEISASVEAAKQTVAQVRQRLEEGKDDGDARTPVNRGAGDAAAVNVDDLSPSAKIAEGIRQRRAGS